MMNALQHAAPSPTADLVIVRGSELVTTTLAIAAGTANTHEAVIKLVRAYQKDLAEFGLVGFEIQPKRVGQRGGSDTEYAILNEDHAALLITYMRNNVIVRKFKIALVRSFGEMRRNLAAQAAPMIPNFADAVVAARAWADAREAEQKQAMRTAQLEHQVAEQAPAVAGFELIANADGAMCVTDTAKILQLQPNKLRDMLFETRWIYRRQGKNGFVAYQDKIDSGYLKHRVSSYKDPKTGKSKTSPQVLVTSKGLAKLSELLSAPVAPPKPGHTA